MQRRKLLIIVAVLAVVVGGFAVWNSSRADKTQARTNETLEADLRNESPNADSPSQDDSVRPCRAGRPASLNVPRAFPFKGVRVLTPPTIVGCGRRSIQTQIELVAYETSAAFCFSVDRPALGSSIGGECKPKSISWHAACPESLCISSIEGADWNRYGGYASMVVTGILAPDVAEAAVFYDRKPRGQVVVVCLPAVRRPSEFALWQGMLAERCCRLQRGNARLIISVGPLGQPRVPHDNSVSLKSRAGAIFGHPSSRLIHSRLFGR
jgi:hypothetical protein